MYSFCNLLLLFCCDYFICESKICLKSKLGYMYQLFFFFHVKICSAHASFHVTVVDHVFTFLTDQADYFSSQRFSFAKYVI